jgi:alanine racemase
MSQSVVGSIDVTYHDRAWVEINLSAIAHNLRSLKQQLRSETAIMSVVKADAYGHGAVAVARTVLAAGSNWLAVATIDEGIELRRAGITAPILILGAINDPHQVESLLHWQLQLTICNVPQALKLIPAIPQGMQLPIHLNIDTGMSRLGVPWVAAGELIHTVLQHPEFKIVGIYSHCATADELDQTRMRQQQQRFEQVLAEFPLLSHVLRHFANSAATLTDRDLHYDMVRPGLITYGLYPAAHLVDRIDLIPAFQVRARITQIKSIPAGTHVSYGNHFCADRPMTIAVVGIGYADGIPRRLSNRLEVLIHGQIARQIGAITMDQLILDITNLPQVAVGDVVTLLGQDGDRQITVEQWADRLDTIPWEVVCGFKHRLPRITTNVIQNHPEAKNSPELYSPVAIG